MPSSVKYWVWLSTVLDPSAAHLVCRHFSSPADVFAADPSRFDSIPGLTPQQRKALRETGLERAEEILDDCARKYIRIITWQDTSYPERLRNSSTPPLVFYARGRQCHFDEEAAIAMAGTRRASAYGKRMAQENAYEITALGGLVVTGIVSGCDYSAAASALQAGGPLVCVLAGGVDVPYHNNAAGQQFLEEIAAAGTLVSLAPPGTSHWDSLFHARNELLTGLTVGTVCVEVGQRSGTLQVARLTLDQGRPVFVLPANVGIPSSAGTNELLRQGMAIPILRGRHVLEEFAAQFPLRLEDTPSPIPPICATLPLSLLRKNPPCRCGAQPVSRKKRLTPERSRSILT